MKFITLILFFITLGFLAKAQTVLPKTIVDVKVTSVEKMRKILPQTTVVLYRDNKKIDSVVLEKGRYKVEIDTGYVYKIIFSKEGYVSKSIVVNTKDAPQKYKKRAKLKLDIGLFHQKEGLNVSFLRTEPIGYARYDFVSEKMEWDRDYLDKMKGKIVRATLDYAKKKRK